MLYRISINNGKIEAAGRFVWEDVVEQIPFPGQGPGLEGLKGVLCDMRGAFSDLHFSVEEQVAEGDKVLTRFPPSGAFSCASMTGRQVRAFAHGH
jgi:predicted ester cyclase